MAFAPATTDAATADRSLLTEREARHVLALAQRRADRARALYQEACQMQRAASEALHDAEAACIRAEALVNACAAPMAFGELS